MNTKSRAADLNTTQPAIKSTYLYPPPLYNILNHSYSILYGLARNKVSALK